MGAEKLQQVALYDRGGAIVPVDSDALGIQNIGGVLKQVNPDGSSSTLGGGAGVDPGTAATPGGNIQDWDFATGLTEANLGDVWCRGTLVGAANNDTFLLQPNGANPTTMAGGFIFNNNTVFGGSATPATTMTIAAVNAGLIADFFFQLSTKHGVGRMCIGWYIGDSLPVYFNYVWRDTATVLTSLRLHGTSATTIKSTCSLTWGKLGRTT